MCTIVITNYSLTLEAYLSPTFFLTWCTFIGAFYIKTPPSGSVCQRQQFSLCIKVLGTCFSDIFVLSEVIHAVIASAVIFSKAPDFWLKGCADDLEYYMPYFSLASQKVL